MSRLLTGLFILFFFKLVFSQRIDTLKYYCPFDLEDFNMVAFVEGCQAPGYCEPIAVFFTPDSSVTDSSFHYYSIKKIRFCLTGEFSGDTTFTIHLGADYPDQNNQIYQKYFSVDSSDINQYFTVDGIYKFKDIDLSTIKELRDIDINIPFWVSLPSKVWTLYNTTNEEIMYNGSFHSFLNWSPTIEWKNLGGDWIMEAIIQYQKVQPIEENYSSNKMPQIAQLYQNYPNPFNSDKTELRYYVKKPGYIQLDIYSSLGQKIGTLINKNQKGGDYNVIVNLQNLSSGIYFYVLKHNELTVDSKKMVYIR